MASIDKVTDQRLQTIADLAEAASYLARGLDWLAWDRAKRAFEALDAGGDAALERGRDARPADGQLVGQFM